MCLHRKHLTAALLLVAVGAAACASHQGGTPTGSADGTQPVADPPIACVPHPLVVPERDFFTDISAASGIQKNNFVPSPATPIPINDHSRLAFADIDGDGVDDIVMHNL